MACSISDSSSRLRERAVRRIQKIIQVTIAAARIESVPPTTSWALNDSWSNTIVTTANTEMTMTSAARTPAHTWRISWRRLVLTR